VLMAMGSESGRPIHGERESQLKTENLSAVSHGICESCEQTLIQIGH
jgi:hypothetical protein